MCSRLQRQSASYGDTSLFSQRQAVILDRVDEQRQVLHPPALRHRLT